MKKKMTIRDIAQMSGVSKTTISRYLNGKFEYMSEETKERIRSVIEASGYRPSNIAQSLKRNTSNLIGVVVADIESPFSSAFIKSIGDSLKNTNYSMLIANSDNQFEDEQKNIQSLLSQQVDGIIVNTTRMNNPMLIDLVNQGYPIVLGDRFVKNYQFDIAYIDNKDAINTAIQHLLDEGYTSINFFTESYEEISPRYYRRKFFIERLDELSVPKPEEHVYIVNCMEDGNLDTVLKQFMEENKDNKPAIICSNGVTLLYVARTLQELGYKFPEDIGICGYDEWGWFSNIDWTGLIPGGLTTLLPSIHDLGTQVTKLLIQKMKDKEKKSEQVIIPASLNVKDSTKLSKKEG